jgi:crossover junction endodeoxyribonuclease RusA
MIKMVGFTVFDDPEAPGGKAAFPIYRGSKKAGTQIFTGKVAITDKNRRVPLWRASVTAAARPNGVPLVSPALTGPLVIRLRYTIKRPVSVSPRVRPYPTVKPDLDNLVKPTQDAITGAGLWRDDALIVSSITSKAYEGGWHADGTPAMDVPGCVVEIFRVVAHLA